MKRMAMISACVAFVCLLVLPASAGDKKQAEPMTVEQMHVQVLRARSSQRDMVVLLKGGGMVRGKIQDDNARGFSLKDDKSRTVWVDYSDVQAIKLAGRFKYVMFSIVGVAVGAAALAAMFGLTAWIIILIVNL